MDEVLDQCYMTNVICFMVACLQVKKVLSLKMGSNQADHEGQSGLCFAMDWLHVKPHNLLAAGFYDGDFICFVFRSICSSRENWKM